MSLDNENTAKNLDPPSKIVSWDAVCTIANQLCNNLERIPDFDSALAYVTRFPGFERDITVANDCKPVWISADARQTNEGWEAYTQEKLNCIRWYSRGTRSMLEALKLTDGLWQLSFSPPAEKPDYRGFYYTLFCDQQGIGNADVELGARDSSD